MRIYLMRPKALAMAAVVALVASTSERAAASAVPPVPEGWYLMVGGPIAYTNTDVGPASVAAGGEASLVCFVCTVGPHWMGAYADVVRDFGSEQTRLTVGPELGYTLLGVDGGLLVEVAGEKPTLGVTGRVLLTLALAHLYVRGGGTFGDHGFSFFELGLLWKLPLLWPDPR